VCFALGVACARPAEPSHAPLDPAALDAWLHPSTTESRADGSSDDGAPRGEWLDPVLELVARRRALDIRERPELDAVSRVELVERAWHWIETQSSVEQRAAEAELLVRLELLPADIAWEPALRAVLARRLKGFYDPSTRRIVIDRQLPPRERRRVLAHELVHALADQHHALGARLTASGSSDRRAALLTLAEGDAESLVGELALPELDAAAEGDEPELPGVLARSLSAAYVDGVAAVQRVVERGGFAAVDKLYHQPLDGTHQLLAPSFPLAIPGAVAALPGVTAPEPGWRLRHADVLGAQTWRTVLEEWLPPARAAELARGWDGDRLELFERSGQRLLVWQVRSQAELAAAVVQAVSHGLRLEPPEPAARTPRATGLWCRAQRDGAVMGRWSQGRRLVIAALTDAAQTVQCESLAAWTIPAAPRQTRRRDPGPPRLIGPT
jgi:hypothetical protein